MRQTYTHGCGIGLGYLVMLWDDDYRRLPATIIARYHMP